MNLEKIQRYGKGLASILVNALELKKAIYKLSASDFVIKKLDDFYLIVSINDGPISKPILLTNNWEPNITTTIKKYLKEDLNFLDIGANIGYYSLLVASNCKKAKIYSFEPDTNNFKNFMTSITFNQLQENIEAYPFAVSNENTELFISDFGVKDNSGARFTHQDKKILDKYENKATNITKVKAVKLDDFLVDKKIDLVKIDIEGYELFALEGMKNLLQKNKPVILAEFAPNNLENIFSTKSETFLNFFVELDYKLKVIDNKATIIDFKQDINALINYHNKTKIHHSDLLIE